MWRLHPDVLRASAIGLAAFVFGAAWQAVTPERVPPGLPPIQLEPGALFTEFGPLPALPTQTPAAVTLGAKLFEDPKLSGSGQIACASCHNRELAFADGVSRSFGHDRTRLTRNAPSLVTAGWMSTLFWDGRADSLETQAILPILHPDEMHGSLPQVRERLAADAGYRDAFADAFGDAQVTDARIAQALAAFQRSLSPRRSRYSRFIAGEVDALDAGQKRGLALFRGKAGCASCHNGPLLSDQRFHNLGLSFYGRQRQDLGRYAVTGAREDVGAFRTPSLLGVSRTAPYMHNGGIPTLAGVVAFYNAGGARPRPRGDELNDPLFPETSALLRPRNLTREEQADLVAFLEAL
ncbi:cytochrome c peroxidase [Brevundimonas sp.]|uniref:cytochrome-c peroxidase n=1 Tax=Brevundimonas sp. TaxID=1871086 RepID=UPI0028A2513D|nr:cytochrome c peroxidase [Brevundimonas sp.]